MRGFSTALGIVLFSAALPGCLPEVIEIDTPDFVTTPSTPNGGGTSAPAPSTGTPTPATPATPTVPTKGTTPGDPNTSAPAPSGGVPAVNLAAVRDALKNKSIELGSSIGNGDNNAFVTSVDTMVLCATGEFSLKEVTIFSSNVGGQSSEDFSNGVWDVVLGNGGVPLIQLSVQQSSSRQPGSTVLFTLAQNANGALIVDNRATTVTDASGECGQTSAPAPGGQGGGQPGGDPGLEQTIQQVTAFFNDTQVETVGPNGPASKFVFFLCSDGNARLDLIDGNASQTVFGTWFITPLQNGGIGLALDIVDNGQIVPLTFALSQNQNNQILIDGDPATIFDLGAAACQQALP